MMGDQSLFVYHGIIVMIYIVYIYIILSVINLVYIVYTISISVNYHYHLVLADADRLAGSQCVQRVQSLGCRPCKSHLWCTWQLVLCGTVPSGLAEVDLQEEKLLAARGFQPPGGENDGTTVIDRLVMANTRLEILTQCTRTHAHIHFCTYRYIVSDIAHKDIIYYPSCMPACYIFDMPWSLSDLLTHWNGFFPAARWRSALEIEHY